MIQKHFIFYFLFLSHFSFAQGGYDTVKLFFDINHTIIEKENKSRIDSIISFIGKKKLLIYGYADYLGNEPSNLDLAKNRALHVKEYLQNRGIESKQVLICEGIGEVKRDIPISRQGIPEDRRVAIFIRRDAIVQQAKKDKKPLQKKGIQVAEINDDGKLIPLEKNNIQNIAIKPSSTNHLLVSPQMTPSKTNSAIKLPSINSRFESLLDLNTDEVMRIETIHFQPTRHYITKESEPILQELLKTLLDYPNLAINIEGHVCCMKGDGDALDTDTFELKLSENRAKFIYQYLIEHGISASRLGFIGFGKRKPIIPIEHTEEDAQRNRRVEIRVVRK